MGYPDITEEFQIDLSNQKSQTTATANNIAYDVSVNNLNFVLDINAQTPYKRDTAQYKKDQFDAAPDPGEQTLVASWWLRSQTSWHLGAGVKYFDPGIDYQHQVNRFYDSRGVDVWTKGDAKLHKDIAYVYSDANNHNFVACAASYYNTATKYECMVLGDSGGSLKRFRLNGDSVVTTSPYIVDYSPINHNTGTYPFYSVCTDGNTYYAACSTCVHTGSIDGTTQADRVLVRHGSGKTPVISYAKGYIFLGDGNQLWNLNPSYVASPSTISHSNASQLVTTGNNPPALGVTKHINPNWTWNAVAAGRTAIWAAGYGDGVSEIWGIQIDDGTTGTSLGTATNLPAMANATVIATLPYGEQVQCMEYYFGNLIVGTNKGVRICKISANMVSMKEFITVGPLLWDYNGYGVNSLSINDKYVYAATAVDGDNVSHRGCLVRIDLSREFEDGTYAYAYDLEDSGDENSIFTQTLFIDGRRVVVTEEAGTSGEIKVEHSTKYVTSGYLQTGFIRYATIEPKYFKNIKVNALYPGNTSVGITTIDSNNQEYNVFTAYNDSGNQEIATAVPSGKQEMLSYKLILNSSTDQLSSPIVQSYQVKAIPATPRQRVIQFPLACYDSEMDRYNIQYGHQGRAYEILKQLEDLESLGDTVIVKDWRTDEQFIGLIESVSFVNQSSPDKKINAFGGVVLLTVRKL